MSRDPPRHEWNSTSLPSGDSSGAKSSDGSLVSCSRSPPAAGMRKRSEFPVMSGSNANHLPSRDNDITSMDSVPFVSRTADVVLAGNPLCGTGMDQMLAFVVYSEYASLVPLPAIEMVCAPSPVVRRSMGPAARPCDEMGTEYTSFDPSRFEMMYNRLPSGDHAGL